MATHREEPEISAEEPLVIKPRISVVVILSILLGVLLALGSVGAYWHWQQSNALQAEMRVATAALKEKSVAVDEMKAQIEALSKQMYLLKEYSVARSSAAGESKAEAATPSNAAADTKDAAVVEAPTPAPVPVKAKKPKPETQNCELVGKSAEEQAATLKRCVTLIDSPGDKARSR